MPTYSIQGPDGKTYSIDGPAGASRDDVIAQIKSRLGQQASSNGPSVLGDVAKSFGRGIVKGAAGVVGLPGEIESGVRSALDYVMPLPGGQHEHGLIPPPPTGEQVEHGIEAATGPLGEPQTTAGRYAQSIGEFVPSAFVGPEGAISKAAMTVGGGVGSEAAGELTEGTDLEPYARFAGGLVGGGLGGFVPAEVSAIKLSGSLPTVQEIKDSAKNAYRAVAQARLHVQPSAVDQFVANSQTALDNDLIVPAVAPRTYRALDKLQKAGGDIGHIMGIRQTLGDIKPNEGTEYAAARRVIEGIDKFVETLNPQQVMTGDPQYTQAMLNHARSSWRAYRKLDEIENMGEQALHRAQSTGTGANYVNAVRQQIRKILDSDSRSRGYSKEAKAQMEKMILGGWWENTTRHMGKYAPTGPVSATTSILTGMAEGPTAGATVATVGFIAKNLSKYLTQRQLRQLEDIIRAEAPIGRNLAPQLAKQAAERRKIAPAAALRSALAAGGSSPLAPGSQ